ncbi:TadE/TadG family type IV pilus assembly protein [Novosphingobium bradum]|uniref:TadE/TadG family type IV pilus assembly protein n=1 Tax=Novosphingobium bradum TaxID=1737444 RepID=A0ABV7IL43_9SPHN
MTARAARALRRLAADARGAALVEFAIIIPVVAMLLLGSIEFGLNVYMRAVLEGAMQQAGRNSSLQTAQASQTAIDTFVRDRVQAILPNATVTFVRENYQAFQTVGRPEDFTDTNGNGVRDTTECFQDANGNNTWDADGGRSGIGGANDVVEYTATVSYASIIPGGSAIGLSPTTSIKATTMLRNQPFASQPGWSTTRVCP